MNCCQHEIDQKDEQVFHKDNTVIKVFQSDNAKFPTAEKLPGVWSNSISFVNRLLTEALKCIVYGSSEDF